MQLSKRQKDIILYLIKKNTYATVEEIAKDFGVSDRTVRSDFEKIDVFLKDNEIEMERVPNRGCMIRLAYNRRPQLMGELFSMTNRTLSQSERILIASVLLLVSDRTTTKEIADLCFVDRQTVLKDLRSFDDLLSSEGLYIVRKAGVGLSLEGPEENIRRYFGKLTNQDSTIQLFLSEYMPHEYVESAGDVVRHLEAQLKLNYLDSPVLITAIAYVLLRAGKGRPISGDYYRRELEPLIGTPEYKILDSYEKMPDLDESDRLFIAKIVMRSKVSILSSQNMDEEYVQDKDVEQIAEYLMEGLKDTFHLDFENETDFINGLRLHLKVSIYRLRHDIYIENDLLEQIKVTIPLIFEFTKKILIECEEKFDLFFNDNEIAFISMHVAAAYEKNIHLNLPTLLIICNFGIATSKILAARMHQILPECTIIGPLSSKEAEEYLSCNVPDLIVSTSGFAGEIPMVVINPLLLEKDVELINNWLMQINYSKQCRFFIDAFSAAPENKERTYVKDYMPADHIAIMDGCEDWISAVQLAAKPLLNKGYIEQRYVDKMIEAIVNLGSYMVIVPEIAFIHAGVNDGINQNCSSILVLKKPMLRGAKNLKKVRALVVLGIKERHDDFLLRMINIFENNSNLATLAAENLTVDTIHQMHS